MEKVVVVGNQNSRPVLKCFFRPINLITLDYIIKYSITDFSEKVSL